MNCCDSFGQCNQGRDCPVRTGRVLPHQLAHAAIVQANSCTPEGGNVWFAEPEPVDLAGWDVVAIYVAVCLAALVSFATVIGLVGFAFGRWLA